MKYKVINLDTERYEGFNSAYYNNLEAAESFREEIIDSLFCGYSVHLDDSEQQDLREDLMESIDIWARDEDGHYSPLNDAQEQIKESEE